MNAHEPFPDAEAAEHPNAQAERDALVAALRALAWLDRHADDAMQHPGCVPCRQFTAALLRRTPYHDARTLRCQDARGQQARVDAGLALIGEES